MLNFREGGGAQKIDYFRGFEDCVDILGVIIKLDYFRIISMHFRFFLKVEVQNRNLFLGLTKFIIFWGMPDIPDIFWGKR